MYGVINAPNMMWYIVLWSGVWFYSPHSHVVSPACQLPSALTSFSFNTTGKNMARGLFGQS